MYLFTSIFNIEMFIMRTKHLVGSYDCSVGFEKNQNSSIKLSNINAMESGRYYGRKQSHRVGWNYS